MDTLALHQAMLDPATYPDGEGPVEFRETHVSRLYLTRQYVYKIKKPVDFGFLDFTTLEKRRFFCLEEVRLNRRFAPDTYLDVAPLCRAVAGIRLGEGGEVIEYAVQMRRLPAERMLDRRLAAGDRALPAEMENLGKRLAELADESPICHQNGDIPNLDTIRINWQENFRQAAPFAGSTLTAPALSLLTNYVNRFIDVNSALLTEREQNDFVRDGHGDIHAEHICLTDPIRIYDCIEFNRRFRVADIVADIAFLLMDLEFRGRGDLAALVQKAYSGGRSDPDLVRLLPFYKIYRAFVRGKVESFLARDAAAGPATRQEAEIMAGDYFSLALGYLCPPVLVLIGGLMGSGKSTVATALARATGGTLLRSDVLRKELAGDQAATGKDAPYGKGIYSPDFGRRTYDLLLRRTRQRLAKGTVVADASFLHREDRERFRQHAGKAGIPNFLAITECDRQTAFARMDARRKTGTDPSDGRKELFMQQVSVFEPPALEENAIVIDTRKSVAYNVQSLLCEIIARAGMRQ